MLAMETTLYEDQAFGSKLINMDHVKRRMTLDFNSARPPKKQRVNQLLTSPDLKMLQLGSPELEKFIQQHGLLATTTAATMPTPSQTQYNMFPKAVTEEQEQYARGFVEALAELHQNDHSQVGDSDQSEDSSVITSPITYTTLESRTSSLSLNPPPTTTPFSSLNIAASSVQFAPPVQIKEEPQTVPSVSSSPPGPLSPVDMEEQEKIKLERKRLRNRIAASKCRRRKLERIARLEDKVRILKGENCDLGQVVNRLRDQVCSLKQQVMEHVNSGCQIMLTSQF